eukprot:113902-Rhodomonas_salina.2
MREREDGKSKGEVGDRDLGSLALALLVAAYRHVSTSAQDTCLGLGFRVAVASGFGGRVRVGVGVGFRFRMKLRKKVWEGSGWWRGSALRFGVEGRVELVPGVGDIARFG